VITRISKVIVPVTDQQAALEFWTSGMGFELVRDDSYGNERWIEVRPPEQDLLLVLSPDRPMKRVVRCQIASLPPTCSSTAPTSRAPMLSSARVG
jgi:catechol 2,3-dioxygenase-like lactoylglutathione lyase family enzyme